MRLQNSGEGFLLLGKGGERREEARGEEERGRRG